ncbi:hypothetical protein O1M63_18440 [Streptomyces mirabilis]|nr:hypothetical protein [Streptomyces mirabilis]
MTIRSAVSLAMSASIAALAAATIAVTGDPVVMALSAATALFAVANIWREIRSLRRERASRVGNNGTGHAG